MDEESDIPAERETEEKPDGGGSIAAADPSELALAAMYKRMDALARGTEHLP
jgi:hypothetical protein